MQNGGFKIEAWRFQNRAKSCFALCFAACFVFCSAYCFASETKPEATHLGKKVLLTKRTSVASTFGDANLRKSKPAAFEIEIWKVQNQAPRPLFKPPSLQIRNRRFPKSQHRAYETDLEPRHLGKEVFLTKRKPFAST